MDANLDDQIAQQLADETKRLVSEAGESPFGAGLENALEAVKREYRRRHSTSNAKDDFEIDTRQLENRRCMKESVLAVIGEELGRVAQRRRGE